MANTVALNGSYTLTLDGLRTVGDMTGTVYLTGSNSSIQSQDITSSAYTALNTSSLSDLRMAWFYNDYINTGSGSVITVATDNAGAKPICILWPDDAVIIAWSGSTPLYAKVTSGSKDAVLQYVLNES